MSRRESVVARARRVEAPPRAALRAFDGPRAVWSSPGGDTLVGCGEAVRLTARGPGRFATVRGDAADLFRRVRYDGPAVARPRLLGGFAFDEAHAGDPPWRGFPGAAFVLPRVQAVRCDAEAETWLTVIDAGAEADPDAAAGALEDAADAIRAGGDRRGPPPGVTAVERTPDRPGWDRQVATAVERIAAGRLEKVVLAGTLTVSLGAPFRLADTLERLDEAYPDCVRFAVDPGVGATFFGATPERLVRQRGRQVATEALAGSIGRGGTDAEDDRLARRLRESAKVQHEHAVVAAAIREQLAPLAAGVDVGDTAVRKVANVQHLRTPIEATLARDAHVLDVVEALHPTPAVGGRPPDAALETIRETEQFDRGWYAAPVGWFDAGGDGTFAVGIRSGLATDAAVTLFAGNGIVADSDPDEEWDELQLKFRPVLDQLR